MPCGLPRIYGPRDCAEIDRPGTAVLVAAFFYLLFLVSGVPGFFPDRAEGWLATVPGLDG